jgi:hypothetical protein
VIVTPKAANQLRHLEPESVAEIIETRHGLFRAFIARHKDGSMVLVSITAHGRNLNDHN